MFFSLFSRALIIIRLYLVVNFRKNFVIKKVILLDLNDIILDICAENINCIEN